MNQDGSVALFQYWNRLRGNRPAPQRTEIEPAEIKSLLADTFILQRDARGEPIFRLAGTRLCATYGKELKGHSFTSLWARKDQPMVARLVGSALEQRNVAHITFEGLSQEGRLNGFELVVLPIDGGYESPRALGTVQPRMKPFWLGADPVIENRIEGFRLIDADRESLFLKSRAAITGPSHRPDENAVGERPSGGNGRRIHHLVVFQGGRRQ